MGYRIFKRIAVLLYYVFLTNTAFGQFGLSGVPIIRNYTSASVREITQTWSIQQDKTGIMYFGNSYGITSFDGNHWKIIQLSNNSVVQSMAISGNGTVYAGGMDEIGYISHDNIGRQYYISLVDRLPSDSRNFGVVKGLFTLDNEIIFLCDNRIFIYNNNEFKTIRTNTFFEKGYIIDNKFWVFEKEKGLMELTNHSLNYVPGSSVFLSSPPTVILSISNNIKLIINPQQGCLLFSDSKITPCFNTLSGMLKRFGISCGLKLKNGNMVLGTILKGLLLISPNGNILQVIDKNRNIDNNRILSLYEDCYDNLWAGHDNGISYIEISSPFSYYNEQIIEGTGYTANQYKNTLYLGTSQGLYYLNLSKLSYENVQFHLIPGSAGQVWNVSEVDGSLLMGHNEGTFVVNGTGVTKINNTQGGWKFLKSLSHPTYMFEGCYSGILLYQKEGSGWKFLRRINGFDESCRIFEQDEKGRIWVTHGYKGVFRVELDKKLEKAIHVKFYGQEKGLPSNLGINVFKIKNELLFTSESGGIFKYNEAKDSFTPDMTLAEYIGKYPKISRLYEDRAGNIWINELSRTGVLHKLNNGAYRFEEQPFRKLRNSMVRGFELFGVMPDNTVLFGFGSGFVRYNPSIIKNYNIPFYTFIRKVELTGNPDSLIYFGENTDTSYKSKPNKISYKHNSLKFSFAAPYFEDNDEIKYKYYLEGYNDDWSDWTPKTEKEYTNLDEGKYTLHAKAVNIYGVEGRESTFSFIIEPHWANTWWAYCIYIFAGGLSLWLFLRFYTTKREARLRKENLLKEREIIKLRNQQLNNELETKNKELGEMTQLIVRKNEVLLQLKDFLNNIYKALGAKEQKDIISITRKIDEEADIDKEWAHIEPHFDSVHKGFITKLKNKFPELRSHDIKLCAYIQMNLSSKEIAVLMNNTPHGIEAHRYRVRKILGLNREDNLKEFLNTFL